MKADTSREPFTWRATTTSLMAVMLVVAGISIVASSGQGIGWFFLALGLISALVAAAFFRLARKSHHPRN